MVLLQVLSRLNIPLTIAHVNYNLRGEHSDADELLVQSYAAKLGFPVVVCQADPSQVNKGNLQDNARQIRRSFWSEVAQNTGVSTIYLAHHRDDHTESVLMRLLRGAGPTCWHGMTELSDDSEGRRYVRALLAVSREQIEDYARQHQIPFRTDASNHDTRYTRNWIRKDVAPQLDIRTPGWKENLLRLSDYSQLIGDLLQQRLRDNGSTATIFRLHTLHELSDSAARALLHAWISRHCVEGISQGDIMALHKLITAQPGARRILPNNQGEVWRESDTLVLKQPSPAAADPYMPVSLPRPASPDSGFAPIHTRFGAITVGVESNTQITLDTLKIDAKCIQWPVTLRQWTAGDRIHALGASASSLISDILTNHKIRPTKKSEAFVLLAFDEKICAVIFPHPDRRAQTGIIAESVKLTPLTTTALTLRPTFNA